MMKLSPYLFLGLVLVVSGCGAAVGGTTPERDAATIERNERLAIAHLRSLAGAQALARTLCVVDADGDESGEYLLASELTGAQKPRSGGEGMKFPLLGSGGGRLDPGGYLSLHGYAFRVYLPGADGQPVTEGAASTAVDVDRAETSFGCYAWPEEHGRTGRRTFYIDARGGIVARDDPRFSGPDAPEGDAACKPGHTIGGEIHAEWDPVR